jgi:RimJ/RimL family protein N-acetyltransferase
MAYRMMTKLPTDTDRIQFREWGAEDFALAWQLWGDPAVSQYVGGPFSPAQVEARLMRQVEFGCEYGYQYWPLFLREGGAHSRAGEFVGCCGLKPCQYEQAVIEHGFYLRPEFHGRGLGFEAARAVLLHAFATLGAECVFAGHHPENLASQALLAKLGFSYAFDEFYPPTGVQHRGYLLSAADWRAKLPLRCG